MRFKSFQIGKLGKESEEHTVASRDTTDTEVAGIEEKINNKTRGLEKTGQLKGPSDALIDSEEGDDAPPRPHGPLSELTIEPDDELVDREAKEDISNLLDETDEAVTVVEVNTKDVASAEVEKESTKAVIPAETEELNMDAIAQAAENEPKQEEDNDSFNNLFSNEEEEVNLLANLINSLPDVTAQELLEDLQEIKEILQERQQS